MRLRPGPSSMLLGFMALATMPVPVRLVEQHGWGAASTTVVRFGLGSLAILLMSWFGGLRPRTRQPFVLLLRGLFGGISVLTYFFAVQLTGAGMGTLLNYTHSIWSNLFGLALFRQRPDGRFWPILGLAMVGLWLVIHPSMGQIEPGKIVGLLSGMAGGAAIQCIKKLRTTDSAFTIMVSFCGVGLFLALLLLPFEKGPTKDFGDMTAWLLLVAIAASAFGGQLLFTHGYRETSVALGSLMSLSVPVIASLSSWAFLGEPLTPRYAAGATLVLTACGLFGWIEQRNKVVLLAS